MGSNLGRAEHVWVLYTHDNDVRNLAANTVAALIGLGYHYDSTARQDFDKPDTPLELTLLGFSRH
jgi:hypothetical protein